MASTSGKPSSVVEIFSVVNNNPNSGSLISSGVKGTPHPPAGLYVTVSKGPLDHDELVAPLLLLNEKSSNLSNTFWSTIFPDAALFLLVISNDKSVITALHGMLSPKSQKTNREVAPPGRLGVKLSIEAPTPSGAPRTFVS